MKDMIKKVMYTGVGIVSTAAGKVQTNIDEIIKQGKVKEEEGRKVMEDLKETTEAKREEYTTKFKGWMEDIKGKVTFPSPSFFNEVIEKVEGLENKIAEKASK